MRDFVLTVPALFLLGAFTALGAGCAADADDEAAGAESNVSLADPNADDLAGRYGTYEVLERGGFVTLELRADHTYAALTQFGPPADPFLGLTPTMTSEEHGTWFLQSAGSELVLKLTNGAGESSHTASYVVQRDVVRFHPSGEAPALSIKESGSPFAAQKLLRLGEDGCIFANQCGAGERCGFETDAAGGPIWPGTCAAE